MLMRTILTGGAFLVACMLLVASVATTAVASEGRAPDATDPLAVVEQFLLARDLGDAWGATAWSTTTWSTTTWGTATWSTTSWSTSSWSTSSATTSSATSSATSARSSTWRCLLFVIGWCFLFVGSLAWWMRGTRWRRACRWSSWRSLKAEESN